jgi:hypothetical protein
MKTRSYQGEPSIDARKARKHVMNAKASIAEALAILGEQSVAADELSEAWKRLEQIAKWLR